MRAGHAARVSDAPLDLAVVGLGAAGASLAHRLAGTGARFAVWEAPASSAARTQERTWCTWGPGAGPDAGPGPFGPLVAARWSRLRVVAPGGAVLHLDLGGWRYRMLRSTDVERAVRARLAAAGVPLVEAVVDELVPAPGGVRVGVGGPLARAVLDTRPVPLPRAPGTTTLLQHFLGHRVRAARPVFDPGAVTLMDFRVPQPAGGVAFGYVLPTSEREALVEYTEFSAGLLTGAQYRERLDAWTERAGFGALEVLGTEHGVIPMTDASFPGSDVPGVVRFGAAAGAVRPSTGYAFSVLQRQADALAARVAAGAPPVPPRPHGRRHLLMDAVLLAGIASGRLDGAAVLWRLFERNPVQRVLGFLDGATGPADDVRLMASSPRVPMLGAVAELGRRRALRR